MLLFNHYFIFYLYYFMSVKNIIFMNFIHYGFIDSTIDFIAFCYMFIVAFNISVTRYPNEGDHSE